MQADKVEISPEAQRILGLVFLVGFLVGYIFGRGIKVTVFNVMVGSNHNRINP